MEALQAIVQPHRVRTQKTVEDDKDTMKKVPVTESSSSVKDNKQKPKKRMLGADVLRQHLLQQINHHEITS